MEYEEKILADVLQSSDCREEFKRVFDNVPGNPKSSEASDNARKRGNSAYLDDTKHTAQTHKVIFNHFCESIALAPIDSQELALGYGNRSYFLLHIQKYRDSIKDIDRALKITNSDVLKAKLLCRKAECLKRLGSSDFSSTLEAAQKFIDKTNGQNKMKLLQMTDAVQALIVSHGEKVEEESNNQENSPSITDDYSSCVRIQHSEKYGRYLVAAKDYEPGDVIFVEKIYASAFKEGSSTSACDYCSQSTWATIPCSYCSWSMYCSEDCKEKAWNEFHDLECPVISYLKGLMHLDWVWKPSVLIIRLLSTALKETGNIANLKKELESVDQCTDISSRGFYKNDQFVVSSISNIYSLYSTHVEYEDLDGFAIFVTFILIGLTKYSMLKNFYNVNQIEDLLVHEDIMFLGTFMMKIMSVLAFNSHGFSSNQENQELYSHNSSEIFHFDERHCLSTLYSLLNHSCAPTADWRCTEPNKLFVYALQPIKKNSQIFVCYHKCFHQDIKIDRLVYYLKEYYFICDCQACVEMWPPFLNPSLHNTSEKVKEIDAAFNIQKGSFDIDQLTEVRRHLENSQVNNEDIKKLSSMISQGVHWRKPSRIFWILITHLRQVFATIYSPKALSFDQCK